MQKIEASPALIAARAKVADLRTQHQRLAAVLERARGEQATANTDLDSARGALAAAEADSALREGIDTRPARKAFFAARDSAEVAGARVCGLEPRAAELGEQIRAADAEAAEQAQKWGQALAQKFIDEELSAAVGYFVSVLQAANAVATATGNRLLASIVRQVTIPDIGDTRLNLADPKRWPACPEADELRRAITTVLEGGAVC